MPLPGEPRRLSGLATRFIAGLLRHSAATANLTKNAQRPAPQPAAEKFPETYDGPPRTAEEVMA